MDSKLGVAFSGGGIRSAAFCSGVLRRLLKKNAEPDYLSCVSGGGYTGSAYVEWKYKHRKRETADWTNQFFENMRKQAGYFCNCEISCPRGSCDFMILCSLLFFLTVIIPIVGWGSFAFPIAFVIKLFYGQFLDGTLCRKKADSTDCVERTILFSVSSSVFVAFHLLEYFCKCCCENKTNFVKMKWVKLLLKLGQLISGGSFAFTFVPWFINDFLQYLHAVIQVGIIFFTAVLWFSVRILRKYSSLVILIYSYSYVVYWHLFGGKIIRIQYTEERFNMCLYFSLGILAVFSIFGDIPLRLVHIYNRWRLQRAFYFHENPKVSKDGSGEDQCCDCYDIFPGGHCCSTCCPTCMCPPNLRAVTLGDLEEQKIKPVYLSNVVINGWRRRYDKKYCLLTMSSKGFSVIDKQPQSESSTSPTVTGQTQQRSSDLDELRTNCLYGHEKHLKPSDIKLSSAMAMSAAAVSPYLGKHETEEQRFTHILTLLGMEMAAHLVYDMEGERNCGFCHWFCLYFGNFFVLALIGGGGFGLWILLGAHIQGVPVLTTACVIGGGLGLLLVSAVVASICIYSRNPSDSGDRSDSSEMDKGEEKNSAGHRWCVVHLPIYRFFLSLVHFIHDGPKPPAMLHLSDGGHFENYGLLSLLQLRLPKILVADGSCIESDDKYAEEIIQVMEHAREILDCSFTAMDGGDVLTDLKNNYVHPQSRKFPRMYQFKVRYSDKGCNEVPEGHVVLIAPRSLPKESNKPAKANETKESGEVGSTGGNSSKQTDESIEMTKKGRDNPAAEDIGVGVISNSENSRTWESLEENLDKEKWGLGPILEKESIEAVSGFPVGLGCCDCWACCSCLGCCCPCCAPYLTFPRHTTANQFFTPRLFTVYHREGYRACMECDDFLKTPEVSNNPN